MLPANVKIAISPVIFKQYAKQTLRSLPGDTRTCLEQRGRHRDGGTMPGARPPAAGANRCETGHRDLLQRQLVPRGRGSEMGGAAAWLQTPRDCTDQPSPAPRARELPPPPTGRVEGDGERTETKQIQQTPLGSLHFEWMDRSPVTARLEDGDALTPALKRA